MSALTIGDLAWDEKPGRPQAPTRVYSVPLVRPRESTRLDDDRPHYELAAEERACLAEAHIRAVRAQSARARVQAKTKKENPNAAL